MVVFGVATDFDIFKMRLHFCSYVTLLQQLRILLHLYFISQISSAEIFLIGAIAKAVATTATYPLQTVQAILRVNVLCNFLFCADCQEKKTKLN